GADAAPGEDHVGYYLVGPGRRALEAELRYRPSWGERLLRATLDHPNAVYFGSLALLGSLLVACLLAYGVLQAGWEWSLLALLLVAVLLPVGELTVGLLHYVITLL